jgi:cystathionine gamma-synthase
VIDAGTGFRVQLVAVIVHAAAGGTSMPEQSNSGPKPETLLAQAGGAIDAATGGVVPAHQPSTTFVRDENYRLVSPDLLYGRDDNDAVRRAEEIIARLENAEAALLFPSGMAAIAAAVRTVPDGGAIVLQSGIYWGTTKWVREFCARRRVRLTEIDATNGEALAAAVAATRPDLVFVETPSNPWLGIVDIAHAAACAHSVGATLVVDSTAATPLLTRPLDLGADIVMHSATKALNGHSDLLAGVLATRDAHSGLWGAIRTDRHDAGAIIGAFEAWLLIRGLRTLALRVERMSASAMAIAQRLAGHPRIERVLYPGLPGHPGHDLATRQMAGGFGGLMSFLVRGGAPEALAVCGRLRLIHRATSLGGIESLVEHRHTIEGDAAGIPPSLIRLSVGIEHVDDLIADLDQALAG